MNKTIKKDHRMTFFYCWELTFDAIFYRKQKY